jgi:hypothetical protein
MRNPAPTLQSDREIAGAARPQLDPLEDPFGREGLIHRIWNKTMALVKAGASAGTFLKIHFSKVKKEILQSLTVMPKNWAEI